MKQFVIKITDEESAAIAAMRQMNREAKAQAGVAHAKLREFMKNIIDRNGINQVDIKSDCISADGSHIIVTAYEEKDSRKKVKA